MKTGCVKFTHPVFINRNQKFLSFYEHRQGIQTLPMTYADYFFNEGLIKGAFFSFLGFSSGASS